MQHGTLLWLAALLAIGTIGVLRFAWAQPRRSAALNSAGWALLAAAVIAGASAAGAWGVAMASLWAMGAAAVLLGFAVIGSEAREGRAPKRGVGMLPAAGEELRLGRRFGTFAIVVPGALAASIAFAIGLRAIALFAGWSEAGSNALALFTVPIAWGILATVLLMQQRRTAQLASLAGSALFLLFAL